MAEDNPGGKVLESGSLRYAQSKGDSNSLKVRLDTDDIKEKISCYLLGTVNVPILDPETGALKYIKERVGEPLCNMIGYQRIMSYVEAYINKGTVQGNFEQSDALYNYLKRTREAISADLWINMARYGIKVEEFNGILTQVYILVEPFMTRTIGDGERQTTRETTIQQDRVIQSSGGMSFNPFQMFKTK